MNQYMTALLLICATLMGQGQPAQLNVRMVDSRGRQELAQASMAQPMLRVQLGMLAAVDLQAFFAQQSGALLPAAYHSSAGQGIQVPRGVAQHRAVTLLALSCPSTRAP